MRVCMCVCLCGCSKWLQGIGYGWSQVFGGQRCAYMRVFVLCVYRHASAGLSIHVNVSETPRGAACAALEKIRNWMKWLMYKKNFHSNQVKVSNWTLLYETTLTHTHAAEERYDISGNAWFFFFCLPCKKPPDGKMQKRRVSKKEIWSVRPFSLPFFILPSAHLRVNETPSDLRGRSFASYLQLFLRGFFFF